MPIEIWPKTHPAASRTKDSSFVFIVNAKLARIGPKLGP